MGFHNREHSAIGVLSVTVIGCVAALEQRKVSKYHDVVAVCRLLGKMRPSLPDKVSGKARRDYLIVPSLVNRSLVASDTKLLQDDGLVGLGRRGSVVGDPLRSPGLLISGLAPWSRVRLRDSLYMMLDLELTGANL